ncbi:hypothetical protein ACG7TL_001595 [Trametes sanguinea]
MSVPSTNAAAEIPLNPLELPKLPSLNNTLGAFMIGTYISLMLYGLTLHQSYRYFRLFPKDLLFMRVIVVATLILETVHTALCMHTCYYYLVVNYFNPAALLDGVWSIRLMPLLTALVCLVSEWCICFIFSRWIVVHSVHYSFYVRRVYILGARYRAVVVICPILILVFVGFAAAATAEAFIRPTFKDYNKFEWLDSAAFGAVVLLDVLLTGTLIITLNKSRTGFKRTDSMIDLLIVYTINTGLLTGLFGVLSLIFALTSPNNLIYSALNLVATKTYATSLLAVYEKLLAAINDCFNSESVPMSAFKTVPPPCARSALDRPHTDSLASSANDVVEIQLQPSKVAQGDEDDSINASGLDRK